MNEKKEGGVQNLGLFSAKSTAGTAAAEKKYLIIMRGAPGRGKSSTVLDVLLPHPILVGAQVCSADFYFYNESGEYHWLPAKLSDAHSFCFDTCVANMLTGVKTIIIDNTNIKMKEYQRYVQEGLAHGYTVVQCAPQRRGFINNVHDVPYASVARMIQGFEIDNQLPHLHTQLTLRGDIISRNKEQMSAEGYRLAIIAKNLVQQSIRVGNEMSV